MIAIVRKCSRSGLRRGILPSVSAAITGLGNAVMRQLLRQLCQEMLSRDSFLAM